MNIGTDIEEILRFESRTLENDRDFLERIFSPKELKYCFTKSIPAQHLTARFCAKEALIKAMSDKTIPLNKIETLNNADGKPIIKILDDKIQIQADVSLSHCKNYACASVLLTNVKKA